MNQKDFTELNNFCGSTLLVGALIAVPLFMKRLQFVLWLFTTHKILSNSHLINMFINLSHYKIGLRLDYGDMGLFCSKEICNFSFDSQYSNESCTSLER